MHLHGFTIIFYTKSFYIYNLNSHYAFSKTHTIIAILTEIPIHRKMYNTYCRKHTKWWNRFYYPDYKTSNKKVYSHW
ncbi:hypothetical protein GGR06_004207 [Bacteroides reticulotermitis]|uniref:Uncharacterized protein n=1 Tax=Bacteroides reticulotermitis TaxID=1133319 RepID=A0A840DCG8_9BACE|nr:hypothetical protein [Bacteroides reticulotermitis]